MKVTAQNLPLTQRFLALVLALCIGVLSLAAVSPELHADLHAEDSCCDHGGENSQSHSDDDSHSCGVTFLEMGSSAFAFIGAPDCDETFGERLSATQQSTICSGPHVQQDARAPPVEVFV